MAEKKKEYVQIVSPKGIAKYAHLNTPQTKIGDKLVEPSYSVTVLVDPEDAAYLTFRAKIEKLHADALAAQKKADPKKKYKDEGLDNIFKEDTDKDGAPTGKMAIKFKTKASWKSKDGRSGSLKPFVCFSNGAALPADAIVFGGSLIEVSAEVRHTAMPTGAFYTSLQLKAVMVHVLQSAYQRSATDYGFTVTPDNTNAFGEEVPSGDDGAETSADF